LFGFVSWWNNSRVEGEEAYTVKSIRSIAMISSSVPSKISKQCPEDMVSEILKPFQKEALICIRRNLTCVLQIQLENLLYIFL
jgi:hypothetical protein